MAQTIHIAIVTPEAQALDTHATYASIPAHDGQVGIQHLRANLMTKLGTGPLKLETNEGSIAYFIQGGYAQVKNDRLTLLTDEAIPASEIEPSEAQAALKAAQALKGDTPDAQAHKDRELIRARAMLATLS